MRIKSTLEYGLLIAINFTSILALAVPAPTPPQATDLIIRPDKIYDPHHLSLDSMQSFEKIFNFDWNNYTTIESNRKKIAEIELFLKTTKAQQYAKLNDNDRQAFGKILFKLGTFYSYVSHSPELAIERLKLADNFLIQRQDKAWNYNHIAYAYEQKYAQSKDDEDRTKALSYTNKVINNLYSNKKNKMVAFAYCVKGLVENDMIMAHLSEAETSFKNALSIYEIIPEGKDDQYANAKSKLAAIMLDMNRDDEAIEMLQQLKTYWLSKKDATQNPHAANNFVSLGQAYLKIGKAKDARDEIQKAVNIYQNLYGDKSKLLKKPYHLLSEAYKILGDKKLADSYEEKANALSNG